MESTSKLAQFFSCVMSSWFVTSYQIGGSEDMLHQHIDMLIRQTFLMFKQSLGSAQLPIHIDRNRANKYVPTTSYAFIYH